MNSRSASRVCVGSVVAVLLAGSAVAEQSGSHAVISMSAGVGDGGEMRIVSTQVRDGVTNTTTVVTNFSGRSGPFSPFSMSGATNGQHGSGSRRWQGAGRPAGDGKPTPWLGVSVGDVPAVLRAHIAMDAGVGLVVTQVSDGSPAQKAGVLNHDILTRFDDQILTHPSQLRALIQQKKEGDAVALKAIRQGKEVVLTATIVLHVPDAAAGFFGTGEDGATPAMQEDIREWLQTWRGAGGQPPAFRRMSGSAPGASGGADVDSLVKQLKSLAADNRDEVLARLEELVYQLSQQPAAAPARVQKKK